MTEVSAHGSGGRLIVRRILAAFSPATMSAGALEGAVDLAARLGAELETLFVEDTALLQWTELPFVRQIGLHGLPPIPPSQRELELQFRAIAAQAKERLGAMAARQALTWSFKVARGQVSAEVIAAAACADLLIVGSSSRPLGREVLPEPSVRLLIRAVKAPVLVLRSAQPPGAPVHVVLEPRDEVEKLLEAALAMAGGHSGRSTVIAWQPEASPGEGLPEALVRRVASLRVQSFSTAAGIEILIGSLAGGTLVLSATSSLLELSSWWQRLAGAQCTLFVVR